jgi:hypothetical protein
MVQKLGYLISAFHLNIAALERSLFPLWHPFVIALWNDELDSITRKIRPPRLRASIPKRGNDIGIKNDIKVANVCFNLSYLDANFTKFIFNEASMRRASWCDFSRERRDRRRQENKFSIERIEVITLPLEYP